MTMAMQQGASSSSQLTVIPGTCCSRVRVSVRKAFRKAWPLRQQKKVKTIRKRVDDRESCEEGLFLIHAVTGAQVVATDLAERNND